MARSGKRKWDPDVHALCENTESKRYLNIEEKKWLEYKESYRKGLIKVPKYISFCKISRHLR